MVASTQIVLDGIERHRVQLQANVEELRKALSHWTTWEAEYEVLKEGIQNVEDPSPIKIREIARHLDHTLVDETEIQVLLGKDPKSQRSANQVIDMISRRIDYVQQNSSIIEKQLDAAEKRLAGVDVFSEPGMDNEEGLPMMDIEEELDEEGNEVSSSINQTGKGTAQLMEVLRKAGLQRAEKNKSSATQAQEELDRSPSPPMSSMSVVDDMDIVSPTPSVTFQPTVSRANTTPGSMRLESLSGLVSPGPTTAGIAAPQISVSFSNNIESGPSKGGGRAALETQAYNEDIAATNFSRGTKFMEVDESDEVIASYPIIPQGESPEDARLRRQMLQYGLSEVGQVVAELDLDRPTVTYSDDDSDGYDDYNTEEEEEEDEHGRSTRPMITEEYRQQMMALERKLGARMLENVGPRPNDESSIGHIGDIRTRRVQKGDQFGESLDTSAQRPPQAEDLTKIAPKKGVRFAEHLDVSELPRTNQAVLEAALPTLTCATTMSNTIVERPAPNAISPAELPRSAKVSRFKSARSQVHGSAHTLPTTPVPETRPASTGPAGRTLASTIMEHAPAASEPQPPDEFDPAIINHEIRAQYHKARNKYIGQQGGFKSNEGDEDSLMFEDANGRPKKMSRFMAARLKADGM